MTTGYSREHLSQWTDFFVHNPASRHRRRILTALLARKPFKTVLDVGCGDGSLLHLLRERFDCDIFGVERDRGPGGSEPRGLTGFYCVDIAKQAPPGVYDVVVCAEVLEHIPEHGAALRNLRSVCGDRLILTVPGGKLRRTDEYMGHVRHYTADALRGLVEDAGFQVEAVFAWGFPWHSWYKWAQDVVPGAMIKGFGEGSYGPSQKLLCHALYALFWLNLRGAGDQLFLLARIK